VRLDGLPARGKVTTKVVNCVSFGDYARFWIIGLALDEPGNVWGIENAPADWSQS
jgi:hypothetical protein